MKSPDFSGLQRAMKRWVQALRAFADTVAEAFAELSDLSHQARHALFDAYHRTRWESAVTRARRRILAGWGRWRFDRALDRVWFRFHGLRTGATRLVHFGGPVHGFNCRDDGSRAVDHFSLFQVHAWPSRSSTQIRAINRTGIARGWELYDSQGNKLRIAGKQIDIRGRVGEANSIDVICELVEVDVQGELRFLFQDPATGSFEAVESVIFKNGSAWHPGVYSGEKNNDGQGD